MSVAGEGEAVGVEEVMEGAYARRQSVYVKSERVVVLQINSEDFIERVIEVHPDVKKLINREVDIKKAYHKKREAQLTKF